MLILLIFPHTLSHPAHLPSQTRCPDVPNPDQLRAPAEAFLERSLASDVALYYPPSQVRGQNASTYMPSAHHSMYYIITCIVSVMLAD